MDSPSMLLRSWIRASDADAERGLLGFVSLMYADLILDGITVRRTAEGRITLSYPARTDRAGRRHANVRPADDGARRRFEVEVLGALARQEDES